MRKEWFWSFILDNGIAIATVLGGIAILVLQSIEPPWFDTDTILRAMLGLLILIATSEVVERARSLNRIEVSLKSLLEADPAIQNQILVGDKEIYAYWDRRVETLEKQMDSIRFNRRFELYPLSKHSYRKRLPTIAAQRNIVRRYIVVFHDLVDLERIEGELNAYRLGTYYVGYLRKDEVSLPMITFSIADGRDVTFGGFRRPYDASGQQFNVLSTHPETVALFQNYFDLLWSQCTKLVDSGGVRRDLIEGLRQELGSN